jgi:hypothetical protein
MNGSSKLPPLDDLKGEAKRLRASRAAAGKPVGHSKSLELLAHRYGYRDWNTLHAAVGNQPPPCPVKAGDTVSGTYLGQPFTGTVIDVDVLDQPDTFRVAFDFDEAVDVVTFESFSNLRKRVSCTIDSDGVTSERTFDGQPHMRLAL